VSLPSRLYQHALDSGVYLSGVDASPLLGRRPIERGSFGRRCGSVVFLIIGQSNAANHGQAARVVADPGVYNFNLFDGLVYPAQDPLLGATGVGGSPWCLMADSLIACGFANEILLAPLAVGGATAANWAPGGPYNHRLMYALDRLASLDTLPTHILWHQGEADALFGTDGSQYIARARDLVTSIRARGINAPFYAAIATYFAVPEGFLEQQRIIRRAQHALVDAELGILQGPDTDFILDRHDGCHMNDIGLQKHAAGWVDVLTT